MSWVAEPAVARALLAARVVAVVLALVVRRRAPAQRRSLRLSLALLVLALLALGVAALSGPADAVHLPAATAAFVLGGLGALCDPASVDAGPFASNGFAARLVAPRLLSFRGSSRRLARAEGPSGQVKEPKPVQRTRYWGIAFSRRRWTETARENSI